MEVAFFSPYGSFRPESTMMSLLARLLRTSLSVGYLRCNGVFSTCDRDEESDWVRHMRSCSACMGDQNRITKWVGADEIDLSRFLSSNSIRMTQDWISSLPASELERAEFMGQPIMKLAHASLASRFGRPDWGIHNGDEMTIRRVYLGVSRMILAARELLSLSQPELVVTTGGKDYLTATLIQIATEVGKRWAILRWDLGRRGTVLEQYPIGGGDIYHLMIDGLEELDSDPQLWPTEVFETVSSLTERLNLSTRQMRLLD